MDTDKMRKKYGSEFVDKWMNSRMKAKDYSDMRRINTKRAKVSTSIRKSVGEGITREELIHALLVEFAAPPEEPRNTMTGRRPSLLKALKKKTGLDRLANMGRMY